MVNKIIIGLFFFLKVWDFIGLEATGEEIQYCYNDIKWREDFVRLYSLLEQASLHHVSLHHVVNTFLDAGYPPDLVIMLLTVFAQQNVHVKGKEWSCKKKIAVVLFALIILIFLIRFVCKRLPNEFFISDSDGLSPTLDLTVSSFSARPFDDQQPNPLLMLSQVSSPSLLPLSSFHYFSYDPAAASDRNQAPISEPVNIVQSSLPSKHNVSSIDEACFERSRAQHQEYLIGQEARRSRGEHAAIFMNYLNTISRYQRSTTPTPDKPLQKGKSTDGK